MNLVLITSGIALCMHLIRSQLLSVPLNTIAKVGQRVEFKCNTNLTTPLKWDFADVDSTRFQFIYLNEEITSNFSSTFKVDTSRNGHWTLIIDSADMSKAGTYRCLTTPNYHIGEEEMSVSAQLIVLDSDPLCNTNASNDGLVEGDYIRMWCSVSCNGNWIPAMECIRSNGQTVDANIQYSYESSRIRPTLSLVTQVASSDNGITFTCKMSLKPNATYMYNRSAKVGETRATNIPRYSYLWNYTANVLYGPRNQTIMLIDDELKVGSRMVCFAEGNPAPSYEWELFGKNISINNGSLIVINESVVSDEEQTLLCTAKNSVAGEMRKNEATFTFNLTDGTLYSPKTTTHSNDPNDPKLNPHLILGISVVVLILGLAITVIIYKITRKVVGFRVAKTQETAIQPIYAVVKKERNGDVANTVVMPTNNYRRQQEIPVYTEVKKPESDKKKARPTFAISSPTEKKPKQNYTGADGTQYVELNSLHDQKSNGVLVKQNPMFSLVETYASIDHTLAVPPPTPPPVPKRK